MIVPLIRALERFFSAMPRQRALRWGVAFGWFLGRVLRLRRAEVLRTISRCFPERPPAEVNAIADGMYRNMGLLFVEILRFAAVDSQCLHDLVEFEGENPLPNILKQGRGALILTAHIGNFELLCTMAPILGVPLTVITKTIRPASLNEHWEQTRRRLGVKTLPARNSFRACRQVLKNNEVLGFVLDQNMKRKHGIFVDFFGRPAYTSPGLAFLSAHAQTPVVPAFIVRKPDGRHCVKIMSPLPPPPDTQPATIHAATQTYTKIIEDMIRAYPEQWTWLHRRWRTQPLPQAGC